MRTPINSLVTQKCLELVNGGFGSSLVDAMLEDEDHASQMKPLVKNVCAKVSVALSDEIDSICGLLSISKRAFLEAAMSEAVAQAHSIIEQEGVHAALARDYNNGN